MFKIIGKRNVRKFVHKELNVYRQPLFGQAVGVVLKLLEKLQVNPINNSSSGQNITELVELHNYIVANFFQSIGIKSNSVMKRERLIRDEIESQDDFLQVSILEILSSWQAGLDEVNKLYGTSFKVELNPVLLKV